MPIPQRRQFFFLGEPTAKVHLGVFMDCAVSVIGGSVSGLLAALALSRVGIRVTVYERLKREEMQEGSGLWEPVLLSPEVVEKLKEWGVSDFGLSSPLLDVRSWKGVLIKRSVLSGLMTDKLTFLQTLRAAAEATPDITIIHEKAIVSVADIGWGTESQFSDGVKITSDAVIGADGMRSTVRKLVFSDSGLFSLGIVEWTGTISDQGTYTSVNFALNIFLGRNAHAVVHRSPKDMISWVLYLPEDPLDASYHDIEANEEIPNFKNMGVYTRMAQFIIGDPPMSQLTRIILESEKVRRNVVRDLIPMKEISKERVTLVGVNLPPPSLFLSPLASLSLSLSLSKPPPPLSFNVFANHISQNFEIFSKLKKNHREFYRNLDNFDENNFHNFFFQNAAHGMVPHLFGRINETVADLDQILKSIRGYRLPEEFPPVFKKYERERQVDVLVTQMRARNFATRRMQRDVNWETADLDTLAELELFPEE